MSVSVKDFGAIGDGVHDDTVAIQAALNAGDSVVEFPSGAYLCNNASQAPWPDWYSAKRLFSLPGIPLTLIGSGASTIVTDYPVILFDTASALTMKWLGVKCRSGFTTAGYSFAVLVRGNLTCYNVIFTDWTNAIKYMDVLLPNCQNLDVRGCVFQYDQGIADADISLGYPSTAILGGGRTTTISGCDFNGHKAFSSKPADGLIKTIKQISSLTISGCTLMNYGEEAIACDGYNGLVINIDSSNKFYPSPVIQGGQCAISLNGTVTGKIS